MERVNIDGFMGLIFRPIIGGNCNPSRARAIFVSPKWMSNDICLAYSCKKCGRNHACYIVHSAIPQNSLGLDK